MLHAHERPEEPAVLEHTLPGWQCDLRSLRDDAAASVGGADAQAERVPRVRGQAGGNGGTGRRPAQAEGRKPSGCTLPGAGRGGAHVSPAVPCARSHQSDGLRGTPSEGVSEEVREEVTEVAAAAG